MEYEDVVDYVLTYRPDLDPHAVWVKIEHGAESIERAIDQVDATPSQSPAGDA